MGRALRLASLSLGMTWPNPGVGCVLVRDGHIIGQGRHRRCGELHAETSALADAVQRNQPTRGATAYVTLAPCTRQGRQPPCSTALIAAGVVRVVAAIADPHQDDAGRLLAVAGISYEVGCRAGEAEHVHAGFLSRIRRGRPRITGKWAMTLDGSIAAHTGNARWISSPGTLALTRRRRRAFDAIAVGAGTVRSDDPTLLCPAARTHGDDQGPARVVLGAKPPASAAVWRDQPRVPVLIPPDRTPAAAAAWLGAQGINELLIEGGAGVHGAWLRADLYDRLELVIGAVSLGGGLPVCRGPGIDRLIDAAAWEHEQPPRLLGGDVLLRLRRRGT